MAVDRHRYDDPDPYLYKTDDYGHSWVSLSDELPPGGHVQVVRTDGRNRDLLFVGTEFGLFVSLDGGATWTQLRKGLPPVAVHDLAIQPRDRELVIATHGRGLFVMDAAPLEQRTPKTAAEAAAPVRREAGDGIPGTATAASWTRTRTMSPRTRRSGRRSITSSRTRPRARSRLQIADAQGGVVAELTGDGAAGLHAVQWGLRSTKAGPVAGPVPPGEYVVRVKAGESTAVQETSRGGRRIAGRRPRPRFVS